MGTGFGSVPGISCCCCLRSQRLSMMSPAVSVALLAAAAPAARSVPLLLECLAVSFCFHALVASCPSKVTTFPINSLDSSVSALLLLFTHWHWHSHTHTHWAGMELWWLTRGKGRFRLRNHSAGQPQTQSDTKKRSVFPLQGKTRILL